MNLNSPPPFELGEVMDGVDADGNAVNLEHLGKVYLMKVYDTAVQGKQKKLIGQQLWCVCLKNVNSTALNAKELAKLDITVTNPEEIFMHADGVNDGHGNALVAAVDPFLPSAGVAQNKLFWGIIKGRTIVKTNGTLISVTAGDAIDAYNDGGVDATGGAAGTIGYTLETSSSTDADLEAHISVPWY